MEKDQDAGLQLNICISVDKSVTLYVLIYIYVLKNENVSPKVFPKNPTGRPELPKAIHCH